ncbi:hypothetical protein ACFX1S_032409 [Malus domestica]
MRYLCSSVAWLTRRFQGGRKPSFGCRCLRRGRKVRLDVFSERKKTEFWLPRKETEFWLQMSSARKRGQAGCVFREEEN